MKSIDWYILILNLIAILALIMFLVFRIKQDEKEIIKLHSMFDSIIDAQQESDVILNKEIDNIKYQINILKSQTDLLTLEQFTLRNKLQDIDNEVTHISDLFNHLLIGINDTLNEHEDLIKKLNTSISFLQLVYNKIPNLEAIINKLQKDIKDVSERIKRCCEQGSKCKQGCEVRKVYRMDSTRPIRCCPSR